MIRSNAKEQLVAFFGDKPFTCALRIAPSVALYLLAFLTASTKGEMLTMLEAQALQPFAMRQPVCKWAYDPVFVRDALVDLGAFEGILGLVLAVRGAVFN